jgi:RimJ/RimL family protein N-acetyltransferase
LQARGLSPRDASHAVVCESARLVLRRLSLDDADFIVELLNDPGWLEFIGDKHIHSRDDARRYIAAGPQAMVARHGFGLDVVERKTDGTPLGLCGLIKRDALDDVDLGFAFLPAARGLGHAREAALAVLADGTRRFALTRVAAITSTGNIRSIRLLTAIGFVFQRVIELQPGDTGTNLYLRQETGTPMQPHVR